LSPSTPKSRAPTPDQRRLYRVCPYLGNAKDGEPGHPLHVPSPQGAGRLDNPEYYRVLYVSDHATGAVAEVFGNHGLWTPSLLVGPPALPGSVRALVTYGRPTGQVLDLDNARALLARRLRPSEVVSRDRATTQRWALAAFQERRWVGVRWWSYYEPRWGSLGLWNQTGLRVLAVDALSFEHPAVAEASAVLARPIVRG